MAKVKPFRGLRPPYKWVEEVECRPYDVLSSAEALREAGQNEKSLYHIIKPEINFQTPINEYDDCVYESGVEEFLKFQEKGWLVQDEKECYYLYGQRMHNQFQYGFVLCASVQDYLQGKIKKHELTRKDKEEDRMKHVFLTNANMEPVFLAYRESNRLDEIIQKYSKLQPVYDFVAPIDGFGHQFWVISDVSDQNIITEEFARMNSLYIADGHHRSAAAARVALEKKRRNPHHTGEEEYNYFMAVCFPANQLTVLDYNRVVKDLNGLTTEEFLAALQISFHVTDKGTDFYKPQKIHEFSLYLDGHWYALEVKVGAYASEDSIGVLDVDISSKLILERILGIKDLRTDKRIDFVGGLRGLHELKQRVDSGEMRLALALYPVKMEQIMKIADEGKIMPPKATWFEPKLRSGLVIHKLD